jgi:hypothetical protein
MNTTHDTRILLMIHEYYSWYTNYYELLLITKENPKQPRLLKRIHKPSFEENPKIITSTRTNTRTSISTCSRTHTSIASTRTSAGTGTCNNTTILIMTNSNTRTCTSSNTRTSKNRIMKVLLYMETWETRSRLKNRWLRLVCISFGDSRRCKLTVWSPLSQLVAAINQWPPIV